MNRNNFITEFDHPEHNWKWTKLEVHFINNRMQAHIDYTRAVIAERDAGRKANLDCVDYFNAIRVDYTNLRKAAQMALVALESLFPHDDYEGAVAVWRLGGSHAPRLAIEALRGVLENE